mmetsp:Transcript_18736/g.38993  ORF Transcript_18736/g.38993 Transcript_18736/m.38993 type:complete len:401 (-) Transcript_18736:48-1250(-)
MNPPTSYSVAKKPLPNILNALGVNGKCFRAMDNETGRLWMVSEGMDATFAKDAYCVQLDHKNLVRYMVSPSSSRQSPIFCELCSGGPLSNLLEALANENNVPSTPSLNVVASYLLQITSGLAYLHSQGHFHGGSLGVCVENVFLCRGNTLKLANYFPYSSRSWEEHELSRHQSKDVRDLGNLAAHLFTMDNNLDLPAAARSFIQECNKEGAKAKLLLQHPFLRGALNENYSEHTATKPQKIRRASSSSSSPNPTLPLPELNRTGSIATSGGSTPPINNRKKADQSQPQTNRSSTNDWEGLEDFESFSTAGSATAAATFSAPATNSSKKLTLAQKAFLKNAGGKKVVGSHVQPPPSFKPVTNTTSSSSDEEERKTAKNQAYEMMRKRREVSEFIETLNEGR